MHSVIVGSDLDFTAFYFNIAAGVDSVVSRIDLDLSAVDLDYSRKPAIR